MASVGKQPTRDYQALSDTPWKIWEVLYARRSVRKYQLMQVGDELARELQDVVTLAATARGAPADGIRVVYERDVVEALRQGVYKGIANKINLWLVRATLGGFLVMALPAADLAMERPVALPLTCLAAEDVVLWLTERGLGTCWLAGVNSDEVVRILALDADSKVPIVIPFGMPRERQGADFDNLMLHTISRRRKPLSDIACTETAARSYAIPALAGERCSASPVQDVEGLLKRLSEPESAAGKPPVALLLDACLEAARISPSGGNFQAWRFVTVQDTDKLASLREACGATRQWSAAIVAAGATRRFEALMLDKPFWMIDVPIALAQMSIVATSLDAGVELCLSDIEEKAVNALVGLPEGSRAVGVLGLSC